MPYEDEPTPYESFADVPEELNRLAHDVIGACIEVHRQLGAGLPEEAYEGALAVELAERGIPFERQVVVPITYKGVQVARGRIDLLVGGHLVVEVKAVDTLAPIHRLQVLSYLRLIHQPLGLLINFNVPVLREGIRRVIMSNT
jgi:GxxExxY protein